MAVPTAQDATEVVPYLTSATTIYFIQKLLKQTNGYQAFVKIVPGADKWAHWLFAGLASLIASTGIHLVWSCTGCAAWDPVNGGVGQIAIPGIPALLHGVSDWWKVYVLQQTVHEIAKPKGDLNA